MTDTTDSLLVDPVGGREFRLLRCLGEGGFGAVYLASVRSAGGLQQQVAVKLLRPDVEARNQAVERLRDEAHVLASLRHPVILVAHDLVTLGDRVALVTEYVEGQDLRELLVDKRAPIAASALVDVVGQVASALDAAWTSVGIVHRDVKPANIRIGRHGNVKLMDFGIAISEVLARSASTQANVVMGSLSYLAPERFDVDVLPHPGSDVFALGCVLFEGVTRHRLFHRLDAKKLFALARAADVFAMYIDKQLTRPMPDGVRALLRQMFLLDPDERPTAAEVARRCDALVVELPERTSLRMWCRERQWPDLGATPRSTARSAPPEPPPPHPEGAAAPASLEEGGSASDEFVRESTDTGPTAVDAFDKPIAPAAEGPAGATLAISVGEPGVARATPIPPVGAKAPPRTWWRVAAVSALGASGATVAIVGLVLVALLLAILLFVGTRGGDEVTVPPLQAGELRATRPALPAPQDEQVAPPPVPRSERREPTREVQVPTEAEVPPEAPTEPAEPPPMTGQVNADGWTIELRAGGRTYPTGEVPAGEYDLWVDFGKGPMPAGRLTVGSGVAVTVRCNVIKASCSAAEEG